MTKIKVNTDCGHSPKREFLKDFNVAFGKGQAVFLKENVTEDMSWDIIGDRIIEGKEEYTKAIDELKDREVSEFVIDKVVTHGREGAVNGSIKMKDGKAYAFADFYEFKNTRSTDLKTITSYVIEI